MKKSVFILLMLLVSVPLLADSISTLKNTGLGNDYFLTYNSSSVDLTPSLTPAAIVTTPDGTFPFPPWMLNGASSNSKWISVDSDVTDADAQGFYTYTTYFDLTGLDPASASIAGKWATDNNGVEIVLNGTVFNITTPFNGFSGWNTFGLTSGFVSGQNTLQFVVENGSCGGCNGNPTGLRVEMDGTASPVPEPASVALAATGAIALLRRLRRR